MNELDDFIGKFKRLQQAGKEANLVLNTLAGSAWATLSVRIGPGQHTHQQKARGARNGPAQQNQCCSATYKRLVILWHHKLIIPNIQILDCFQQVLSTYCIEIVR